MGKKSNESRACTSKNTVATMVALHGVVDPTESGVIRNTHAPTARYRKILRS